MGYSLRTVRWRYTEWIHSETGERVTNELYDHQSTQAPTRNLAADARYEQLVAALSEQLNAEQRVERTLE